jgi:hypothetical protein
MNISQATVDDTNPDAPWNREGEPLRYTCEQCHEDVPEEQAQTSLDRTGSVWCDRCLVENAQACGDWDEESLEAQKRLNQNP